MGGSSPVAEIVSKMEVRCEVVAETGHPYPEGVFAFLVFRCQAMHGLLGLHVERPHGFSDHFGQCQHLYMSSLLASKGVGEVAETDTLGCNH